MTLYGEDGSLEPYENGLPGELFEGSEMVNICLKS